MQKRADTHSELLCAAQVKLLRIEPARVILAETAGRDKNFTLEGLRIGADILLHTIFSFLEVKAHFDQAAHRCVSFMVPISLSGDEGAKAAPQIYAGDMAQTDIELLADIHVVEK